MTREGVAEFGKTALSQTALRNQSGQACGLEPFLAVILKNLIYCLNEFTPNSVLTSVFIFALLLLRDDDFLAEFKMEK